MRAGDREVGEECSMPAMPETDCDADRTATNYNHNCNYNNNQLSSLPNRMPTTPTQDTPPSNEEGRRRGSSLLVVTYSFWWATSACEYKKHRSTVFPNPLRPAGHAF